MKVCCYDCNKTDVKLVERPRSIKSGMKNTVDVCISCRNKWYKKHSLFLPRYNFTCPNCKYEQSADTSMAMKMGLNNGHGSCMECGVFLHLEITPDLKGTEMKAIMWGEHLFNDLVSKTAEDLNKMFKDIDFTNLTDTQIKIVIEKKLEECR